jgi:hypothetical protein
VVQNAAADAGKHTHTILPSFKLEGGKGKTALEIGLDIAIGLERLRDLRITPTFKATATDGITTILSTDGSAFAPGGAWQLGIAGALIDLHDLKSTSVEVVPHEVRVAAVEACRAECDTKPSVDKFCTKLTERRQGFNPRLAGLREAAKDVDAAATAATKAAAARDSSADEDRRLAADATATKDQKDAATRERTAKEDAAKMAEAREATARMAVAVLPVALHEHDAKIVTDFVESLDPLELCTTGQEPYLKEERDASLQLPKRVWSAGILVGQAQLKWLEPAAADPMLLTPSKPKYYPQVTLAGSRLDIDRSSSFTREYSLRLDSTWEASHYAAYRVMPRRGGVLAEEDLACAA